MSLADDQNGVWPSTILGPAEASLFALLLSQNALSHVDAVNWAYAQYTEAACPEPWIDAIAQTATTAEVINILKDYLGPLPAPDQQDLVGETLYQWQRENISTRECVDVLRQQLCENTEAHPLAKRIRAADHFFDFHPDAARMAYMEIHTIAEELLPPYLSRRARFIA